MSRNNEQNTERFLKIFLSLGSNLGNRLNYLLKAGEMIKEKLSIQPFFGQSRIYETEAWGNINQEPFLNQIIELKTGIIDPFKVLVMCNQIELKLGRNRIEKWGERTIDIDLLFFGNLIINEPNLIVPHPEIAKRKFILKPMVDLAPNFVHPVYQKTMVQLLSICLDNLSVNHYKN